MFANLHQLAQALGISTEQLDNLPINHISTDSRTIQAGDLFLALVGENFNGHHYIAKAQQNQAVAIIASEKIQTNLPVLWVPDTRLALGKLGAWARQTYQPTVFGITGSNGKTSAKNMLSAILSQVGNTLATLGNLNNDLGVPMTLCRLRKHHRYCVVELGANHVGEITYLAQLVKPEVALVTNAGKAHIGQFGSLDNLVKEKGQLYQSLPNQSHYTAVINHQDAHRHTWQSKLKPKVGQISFGKGGDVQASKIIQTDSQLMFVLHYAGQSIDMVLNFIGYHHIDNALSASACAIAQGISLKTIQAGLLKAQPEKGRLNLQTLGKITIIDDSYNANPESMRGAILTLERLATHKPNKVLVLGAMAELGNHSKQEHTEVINFAHQHNITAIYSIGQEAKAYQVHHFTQVDTLAKHLHTHHPNSVILIKGSRIAKMEQVIIALGKLY